MPNITKNEETQNTKQTPKDEVRLSFFVPFTTHKKLKIQAIENGIGLNQFLRQIVINAIPEAATSKN